MLNAGFRMADELENGVDNDAVGGEGDECVRIGGEDVVKQRLEPRKQARG